MDIDIIKKKLTTLAVKANEKRFEFIPKLRKCYDSGYREGYEKAAEEIRDMVLDLIDEISERKD